jgi:hypothetical protein
MSAGADDPTTSIRNFPGRGELQALLRDLLPKGWEEAIQSVDETKLELLKR